MKKIIYIALGTLMLSSCNIYKQYERPEYAMADSYRNPDGVTSADTMNIADLNWTEIYTDPNLQALINYGIENNTDLLVAIEKVKEAQASFMSAKLSFFPSVGLSFPTNMTYSGGNLGINYDASVSASWEVDLFGNLLNNKRKAQVQLLQNQEYQQAVRTQLIATIADYYFNLMALDKQLNIYMATEKSWAISVETIKAMKEGGMTNEAAVAQYEAYYASIQAAIPEIRSSILKQENALSALLGNYPETIKRGKLDEQKVDFEIQAGIPMQLLSNRPDVKNAEYNLAAMYYNTNIARSAFYPSLVIDGSLSWTTAINAVASLTQPLFNRGAIKAKLEIAKAQEEEARLQFKQTLIDAAMEVSNALITYDAELKKEVARDKQIVALYNAVEYTNELMKLESSTYLEVLEAQQSLLSALISKTEDQLNKLNAVTSLYHALGGGRE
ncbi:MAG: efflux transporter outer membrane subunit [Bacteroidales bacterium]|nr:efflux transporter outer membrane subunit [Bacteroidales bacterium]